MMVYFIANKYFKLDNCNKIENYTFTQWYDTARFS